MLQRPHLSVLIGALALVVTACDESSNTPTPDAGGGQDTASADTNAQPDTPGPEIRDGLDIFPNPDDGGAAELPPSLAACSADWQGEPTGTAPDSFPNIAGVAVMPAGFQGDQVVEGAFSVAAAPAMDPTACGPNQVHGCALATSRVSIATGDGTPTVDLSIPLGELALIPAGTLVTASASASDDHGARFDLADENGPLLLAVSHKDATEALADAPAMMMGSIAVSFGAASCAIERDFCLIGYESRPIVLTASSDGETLNMEVEADTTTGFQFKGATYRVHHARSVDPVVQVGSCVPAIFSQSDFWIMRIPTTDSGQ